jgi:hypothetical protein
MGANPPCACPSDIQHVLFVVRVLGPKPRQHSMLRPSIAVPQKMRAWIWMQEGEAFCANSGQFRASCSMGWKGIA